MVSKFTNNRHLSDKEKLRKGMNPKEWKFKVDNKLRGAFAETDFNKKLVRVNKKKHTDKKLLARERSYNRNPDGSESLLDSLVHEKEHINDPKASEHKVVKRAARKVAKMSTRQKRKTYALLKR